MMETGTAISGMIEARQVLQEDDDDDDDESDGFEQRMDDGLDGGAHKLRRVIDDLVIDILRHRCLDLFHGGADLVGDLDRVRAGGLEDGNCDGLLVVEQRAQ